MSCGAECLLEMMEFNSMDQLRGNPASLKTAGCNCCGGGDNFKPSYNLDSSSNKYGISNSKKGYNLSGANYFEMPAKVLSYNISVNPFYRMAVYQMKAVNVQRPALYQEQKPILEQNTVQSEIDNLEAMILAAKEKELSAWIQ